MMVSPVEARVTSERTRMRLAAVRSHCRRFACQLAVSVRW